MVQPLPPDIEIARAATMLPIDAVAGRAGIPADALIPYGRSKAKIDRAFLDALDGRRDGKLILISSDAAAG